MSDSDAEMPGYATHVYGAESMRVVSGANLGDPVGGFDACLPGDVYRLHPAARARKLVLRSAADTTAVQKIAKGSEVGAEGDRVSLLALLTLLAHDGDRLAVVTIRHDPSGAIFAIPLSPMVAKAEYTLVELSEDASGIRLADFICVSFAAGTLITLPGGQQRRIESLRPGDPVLTRDSGAQAVKWVGKATLRAEGSFAPVVITAGTLGNTSDLLVSPHHRIFIYQRGARRVGGTAEILVQAKHLVDDDRVWRREGGFVDYYSLVFERHEIIFAEGIPAESLMVNQETVRLLPAELAQELTDRFPGLRQSQHFGTETSRGALEAVGRDSLFRPEDHR